jgi:hypothetical protein
MGGARSLLSPLDLEGDALTLMQHLKRRAFDPRTVKEHFPAVVGRDEPKPTLLH